MFLSPSPLSLSLICSGCQPAKGSWASHSWGMCARLKCLCSLESPRQTFPFLQPATIPPPALPTGGAPPHLVPTYWTGAPPGTICRTIADIVANQGECLTDLFYTILNNLTFILSFHWYDHLFSFMNKNLGNFLRAGYWILPPTVQKENCNLEAETAAIYEIAHDMTELHMIFILKIENYKFSIHNIGIDYRNHIIHNSPCVIST